MPKKFKGENSKAAEARARKEEKKIAEATAKKEREEEELWRDDDKHLARKQQRKDEKEKKRLEQLERKKELQKLHDEEMSQLKGAKSHQAKITRAEIEAQKERAAAEAAAAEKEKSLMHHEMPLEENVNRLQAEGEEARTIEEAISVLSVGGKDDADRHPEKRMKAAYLKFEDDHLPRLKQENPNMRLSQLKHMLKKEWMKSPENPLNQRAVAYNSK